eukprot:scaffold117426_cov58-Attheya_sp.AAC.5
MRLTTSSVESIEVVKTERELGSLRSLQRTPTVVPSPLGRRRRRRSPPERASGPDALAYDLVLLTRDFYFL